MSIHPFLSYLANRVDTPLPGWKAQVKMCPAPAEKDPTRRRPDNDSEGNPSSVLIPLYPDNSGELNVILTLRTETIRHAGQISFPGGRSEINEQPDETALRETREEIGIAPSLVTIATRISSLYLDKSDNQITPFVGFMERKPILTRNPNEVKEIITVPINSLLSDNLLKREIWNLRGMEMEVPYWDIHRIPLWGATAMIMSELLEIYKDFQIS